MMTLLWEAISVLEPRRCPCGTARIRRRRVGAAEIGRIDKELCGNVGRVAQATRLNTRCSRATGDVPSSRRQFAAIPPCERIESVHRGVAQYYFVALRLGFTKVPDEIAPEDSPLTVRLDAVDWKILAELQRDGRMTNVELSRRVGISAPPCLRRVRSLEEDGIIKGYRALLDEKQLGYDLMAFAMVHLISQAGSDLRGLRGADRALATGARLLDALGDVDFLMLCVAPDLPTFQKFVLEITSAPNVRNVKTALTLKQSKNAPIVPLEEGSPPPE